MSNGVLLRIIFGGVFALVALAGALMLEMTGHEAPVWLVALTATAGGYVFGHAQANGRTRKHE